MSKANLVYQGKSKLIELAVKFVTMEDHGMETDCLKTKMLYIRGLVRSLERYTEPNSSNSIDGNFLYLEGEKILLSPNNPYICSQDDQMVNVNDEYLNCLTEEEICQVADKLRTIINS